MIGLNPFGHDYLPGFDRWMLNHMGAFQRIFLIKHESVQWQKVFDNAFVEEDYAGAVGFFDANMKEALPENKLEETWEMVLAQLGPYTT